MKEPLALPGLMAGPVVTMPPQLWGFIVSQDGKSRKFGHVRLESFVVPDGVIFSCRCTECGGRRETLLFVDFDEFRSGNGGYDDGVQAVLADLSDWSEDHRHCSIRPLSHTMDERMEGALERVASALRDVSAEKGPAPCPIVMTVMARPDGSVDLGLAPIAMIAEMFTLIETGVLEGRAARGAVQALLAALRQRSTQDPSRELIGAVGVWPEDDTYRVVTAEAGFLVEMGYGDTPGFAAPLTGSEPLLDGLLAVPASDPTALN